MPTYEYKREDGSVFEFRQGINDKQLTLCPETGQKVIRLISGGGGVVYKGDGWYVTDYKNKDTQPVNGNNTDSSPSGSDKKNESTSANNKPADSGG